MLKVLRLRSPPLRQSYFLFNSRPRTCKAGVIHSLWWICIHNKPFDRKILMQHDILHSHQFLKSTCHVLCLLSLRPFFPSHFHHHLRGIFELLTWVELVALEDLPPPPTPCPSRAPSPCLPEPTHLNPFWFTLRALSLLFFWFKTSLEVSCALWVPSLPWI